MEAIKAVFSDAKDQSSFIVNDAQEGNFITTNFGVRINDTDNSLKAGTRGPIILDDFHFREKMTHFDHERIPERVVHARGVGAHGYFECAESCEDITMADFLGAAGKRTPVFVRFSTVLGSKGSADTVRDVRGFAMKFYTQQGNFDIVGNNIPVFFIQDAIKFPDIIHAGKPNPLTEVPQASTAHDNFWDFISLTPETTHMIMWALSDRAIPRSFRMMQGFGVHTFVLYNKLGQRKFVKFHLTPTLGVHSLIWDEAVKIQGADPDFHRNDLYEAIDDGRFPEYDVSIQVLNEADEDKFDFDILDATKVIPEEYAPLKRIGKLVLNRKPDNFFSEVEQVAFCTQHLVPGIAPSNDPLLQGRMFSYLDTQISRLGGPNFEELPINRPICPVTNNQRDGMHRMTINKPVVNYFPNRFGCPALASLDRGGYIHPPTKVSGEKIRARGPKFAEHFNQARLFFNSLSSWEQDHLTTAAIFELSHVEDNGVKERMINTLNKVNHDLAVKVANAIGAKPPAQDAESKYDKKSPPLSQAYYNKANTIDTRKVAFLIGHGFNGVQVKFLSGLLTAGHAKTAFVGPHLGNIVDNAGGSAFAKYAYNTTKSVAFDAVIIVGGKSSIETLESYGEYTQFVTEAFKHAKAIIALDEGVDFVEKLHLPDIKFTTADQPFITSHGVVTTKKFDANDKSAQQDNTPGFARAVFEAIAAPRHFERNVKKVPC